MPLPFDAGVVGSAQGPQANPDGNTHDSGSDLQWAWDFSVETEIVALTNGTVVAYNDSYADTGNPDLDHGFGNYITVAYQITENFVLYQTFAHLRQGSVSSAGIGLGPVFMIEAGDILGVSGTSGGYPLHVHVHFGTQLWNLDYGTYASGAQDPQPFVVFPDPVTTWGGERDYTSPAIFSSSTGVSFGGTLSGDAYFTTAYGDVINAADGDDHIWLRGGSDWINGGEGHDIAYLDGLMQHYTITRTGENVQVIALNGTARLDRIEELRFSDGGSVKVSDLVDGSRVTAYNSIDQLVGAGSGNTVIVSTGSGQGVTFDSSFAPAGLWNRATSVLETLRGWFVGTAEASTAQPATATFNTGQQLVRIDERFETISIDGFGTVALSDIVTPVLRDDHSDSSGGATVMSPGTVSGFLSATGNIGASSDQDWFSIQLQAGQKYAFVLWPNSTTNSNLDPRLTVRMPDGTTRANDNLTATTLMSFVSITATQTGTYYLRAEGVNGTTGDYVLTASSITADPTAGGLTQEIGSADPNPGNSYWHWEGTSGDDRPSELTLESGGRPQTSGNNFYRGHNGDDRIYADTGDDVVWGDSGEDSLYGEEGRDILRGGNSDDRLYGGDGDDLLYGEDGDDYISAGDGDDALYGGDEGDTLRGNDGYDYIKGEDDNDDIDGGYGDDQLYGDRGDDIVEGGYGNDFMMGGHGNDTMDGDAGYDRIAGEGGNDSLLGDDGDDIIYGGEDNDTLMGGEGNDLLHGEDGINTADFRDGDEGVRVSLFDKVAISTDLGIDTLYEIANVRGSEGDDIIDGDHGINILDGHDGNDNVRGHNGNDTLIGGNGNDTLWGDGGNNLLVGDGDDDELRGGLGNDTLRGGIGDDHLRGEQENDTIDGGDGIDTVFFWGEREDFSINVSGAGFLVTDSRADGLEGQDYVTNIEFFEFFDGTVGSDIVLQGAPSATEDNAITSAQTPIVVDVLGNDSAGALGLELISVEVLSGGGTAHVAGNQVVFDPRGLFDNLEAGTSATVTLSYSVRSAGLQTAIASVQVTVQSNRDNIVGDHAADEHYGYDGNDTINGNAGDDLVHGGAGDDTLLGGDDDDYIYGSSGNDSLVGGNGNDFIEGDAGTDIYAGGAGADTFFVAFDDIGTTVLAPDTISDFSRADGDRLGINDFDGLYAPPGGGSVPLYWRGDATGLLGGQPSVSNGQVLPGGAPADGVSAYWIKRAFGGGWVVADLDRDGVVDSTDLAVFVSIPYSDSIGSADFVPGTFTAPPITTIVGTSGNDTIFPTSVSAGVVGGPPTVGDDSIVGGNGNDNVFTDQGNDTIQGEGGADQLFGGFGDDVLDGGSGDDFLRGFTGNDLILGGAGFDFASYTGDTAPIRAVVTFNGTGGHNGTVFSTSGVDTLREIEAINGTSFGDYIQATLTDASSGFQARGYGGNDTIVGTADRSIGFLADYLVTGVTGGITIDLAAGVASNDGFGGQDSLVNVSFVRGTNFADTILGTDGTDRFRGRGGSDFMDARGGDFDILDYSQSSAAVSVNLVTQRAQDGEGGTDTVIGFEEVRGSTANDTILGSSVAEQFQLYNGNDIVDGCGGQDRVIYDQTSGNVPPVTAGVSVNLATGIATDGWGGIDTLSSIERVSGTNFDDFIVGGAESNRFRGRAGNDTLDGGLGGDFAEYVNATIGATVNLTTGIATDGQGGTDSLISIEHAIGGNFADHLTGVAQLARSGSDLRGGSGNDTLVGINDEFVRADYADQTTGLSINLASGTVNDGRGGTDTLINIRGLVMFGDHSDTLLGSAFGEWFSPSEGADSVDAAGGFDIISYAGTDTGGVSINLATGRARDTGGDIDTILGFEGVAGSFAADTIIGSGLGNLIGPAGGADSVDAGLGEDTVSYSLGFSPGGTERTINEAGDRLPMQGVTIDLLSARATDYGGSIDTIIGFEHAIGSTAADLIRGTNLANILAGVEGNDTLEGRGGNDTLDGGAGTDRLVGGLGDDVYILDATLDTVVELANQGIDTIRTTRANLALMANVENIIATNTIAHSLVGNALNNAITGNVGTDTLNGGAGNDTLDGGAGLDRLIGGAGNDLYFHTAGDVVVEGLNQGIDSVHTTAATYTLAANVENLLALGASARSFVGNTLDNALTGNVGADTLNGGAGNDTLDGGAGIDRLIGSAGNDMFVVTTGDALVERLNQGTDTVLVTAGTAYTLGLNFENLVLAGATLLNGTGNGLANVITGNANANVLQGLAGDDALFGEAGNDVLVGGAGQDTLTGGAGNDQFRLTSLADSTVAAPDLIADFTFSGGQLDRVGLNLIDANTTLAGNQAFNFIGGAAFGGAAGQLRVESVSPGVYLASGDVNGDATADFAITIQSATAPVAGWFLL
jgi:Ca2+-binding RTX toxin-like protein